MKAAYYMQLENGNVRCELCPHNCTLKEGQVGVCRARECSSNRIQQINKNVYSAICFDPIEKKPLYHYFPGKEILSLGAFGCNMRCAWCQNCEISQSQGAGKGHYALPEDIIAKAKLNRNNIGIAFTYNEPLVAYDTNIQLAKSVCENGMKNVMVSNGYLNATPLGDYLKYTHAVNLDIKSFDAEIHKQQTGANIDVVLRNAKAIYNAGVHLELTMLIVPGVSDCMRNFEQFVLWVKSQLSIDVPLHISRYFPHADFKNEATSEALLYEFAEFANEHLSYVYLGNVRTSSFKNTYCPVCTNEVVSRNGYSARVVGADSSGSCSECGKKIFVNL